MAIPWATNLFQFHLNKLLKMVSNLALYCVATYLATFQKIGGEETRLSGASSKRSLVY
jgi:hypothetical protein